MRTALAVGLVALTWLAHCPAAADPKPMTPAEKYQALVVAHRQAAEAFSKAYAAAKTDEERQKVVTELGGKSSANHYAGAFLALMRDHPKDPAALDAFGWLLSRVRNNGETYKAAEIVIRDWIDDKRLVEVCRSLTYHNCTAGNHILRAAIDRSPHRIVQGQARFSLALSLRCEADAMANRLPEARQHLEREAEELLQQVADKYGDVKYLSSTLGKAAVPELFELRHLAVGKVVPDIEGEDIDGKPMKLSEFRGKVVLLDFWGTW